MKFEEDAKRTILYLFASIVFLVLEVYLINIDTISSFDRLGYGPIRMGLVWLFPLVSIAFAGFGLILCHGTKGVVQFLLFLFSILCLLLGLYFFIFVAVFSPTL